MTQEVESALGRLFASRPEVDVAAVFGSTATGRERPDSDLDLYVRLRPGASWSLRERLALAGEASSICRREIDLVVEDDTTSVILRREVANHGRPLYEARPGAWRDLRAAAGLAYVDLEPFMRRIGEAVRARAKRHG
ncbi:MAG TPA: nucleotidyltransferase domain-containing protein [Polyangia bacterium]